jgi:uncharacterized protein involved in response to NO
METEGSFEAPAATGWRREPFRLFFPLGVLLGWVGIGHWLLYTLGVTTAYSCVFHGLVQMQAFMMAFAVGFLLTAIPRRTQGAAPAPGELLVAGATLVIMTIAAAGERWVLAQLAYAGLFLLLLQFAIRRFLGRGAGRRPPAAFVLIPIGILQGLAGAALIASSTLLAAGHWAMPLGRLFVEQGVFLCLAMGVGSLVLPLMGGTPPPPDLDASPRERRKAIAYAAAGLTILASFVLEQAQWRQGGPLLRGVVVACVLALGGGALRRPAKPGLHRRLVWLAIWLMPAGLLASAIWPAYRVPALHILFIGGFSLLAFGVATHVALSHLDLERLALGRPPAVALLGVLLIGAMAARVTADWSESYFVHIGWAAALWLAASGTWLAFLGPRLLRR